MFYLKAFDFIMDNIKIVLPVLLLSIASYLVWNKIDNLQDELLVKDNKIKELKETINNKNIIIANKQVIIAENKLSIANLTNSINMSNRKLEEIRVNENKLKETILRWKKQPPKEVIRYVKEIIKVKDNNNVTLKEYIEINNKISNLKYEDL